MLSKNIKYYRKKQGISQEELAVGLHVVRQTVSKWENNLSVPDAETLIRISELLQVSVSQLLDVDVKQKTTDDIASELARLNEIISRKNQKETMLIQAGKKRGLILLLAFLSLLIILGVKNPIVSLFLSGVCVICALFILLRNVTLLTRVTTDDADIKPLRITTMVNIGILFVVIALAVLTAAEVFVFSEQGEKIFAMLLISGIMIFAGIISPKLPYNRHTGLRLPWTVQDEDTWNLAHLIMGYLSLPLALLYLACALTIDAFETVTLVAMVFWIGIPGAISYLFFRKKYHS